MIVQINGVNFDNKGSELMIYAVVRHMTDTYTRGIAAADLRTGTFRQRGSVGLHHLAAVYSSRAPIVQSIVNTVVRLVPERMRESNNLVTISETRAVLDASGFAYTDQWGPGASEFTAQLCRNWKDAGKRIIFLPQAFGPFRGPRIRRAISQMAASADLMFARDRTSYKYLIELAEDPSRIHLAPDFTNATGGKLPDYHETLRDRPCIIPNHKMVSKNSEITPKAYRLFLANCIEYLFAEGLEPFMLIHATGEDAELARGVQTQIQRQVEIIQESNPLFIKGIIGNCLMVIGARYHGLVSSLSQAIPSLGTGWSHKYQLLFEDYGCPTCLVSPRDTEETILGKIDSLLHQPSRSRLVEKLEEASVDQKRLTVEMWSKVDEVLRS
jgi:colanic acid/amylovoran biosynthesis protein